MQQRDAYFSYPNNTVYTTTRKENRPLRRDISCVWSDGWWDNLVSKGDNTVNIIDLFTFLLFSPPVKFTLSLVFFLPAFSWTCLWTSPEHEAHQNQKITTRNTCTQQGAVLSLWTEWLSCISLMSCIPGVQYKKKLMALSVAEYWNYYSPQKLSMALFH